MKKDVVRAHRLLLVAAEAGATDAQYNLGMCLLDGVGVPRDRVAGECWIAKAAKGGNRWALEHGARKRRPTMRKAARPQRSSVSGTRR